MLRERREVLVLVPALSSPDCVDPGNKEVGRGPRIVETSVSMSPVLVGIAEVVVIAEVEGVQQGR